MGLSISVSDLWVRITLLMTFGSILEEGFLI